ncbi:MAG: TRAP transporter large permease subunit [Deltaproteobacteria bacterium]|jgi:tripartite ATP-independent transporter DctM subunit|nr:TRAP transporter large permease subunit [Deltaproteobacteria bacterium]
MMEPWMISSIVGLALLALLATGMPVAFAMAGVSAVLLAVFFGPSTLYVLVGSAFKQLGLDILIAIPLFVLMAAVLQTSGVATMLYRAMRMWMGRMPGGLNIGTVVICAVLAALSGIGATATTTMGVIALPEMKRWKYDIKMSVGAITAGGALGPIIPPSVLMIIIGGYSQVSVGKLFLGGILPGLLIMTLWGLYIAARCFLNPELGPPVAKEELGTLREKVAILKYTLLPIVLAIAILFVIYAGICTPTEAAGFGAIGAIIISIIYKEFTIRKMYSALQMSMKVTSMIGWLIIGGGAFSSLVTLTGTGQLVLEAISTFSFGSSAIIVIMLLIVIFLGMFIDPIAICMICIPVFLPVIRSLGLDTLWFMLLFSIAVVIGYITPPFGANLFYMKGVAPPDMGMGTIYRGVMPYALLMMIALALCIMFPAILVWLPGKLN